MKASDIIKSKLCEANGKITIPLLNGSPCTIVILDNGKSFSSDKLNNYNIKLEFSVFDCIVDLLKSSPNKKAPKGNAHGKEDKVGFGKCTPDTVVGSIAIHYFGKKNGESTLDPVFVLAAVLQWSGIATNQRGSIQLVTA